MLRLAYRIWVVVVGCGLVTASGAAQGPGKAAPPAGNLPSSAQKGLDLAEAGHCKEALPILKKAAPLATDKELKLKAGLATVRCGLLLHEPDAAVTALLWLNREYPDDPDVLYVTTHAYSDLSTQAALHLASTAPLSTEARELNAESLESQGKWDGAAAEYNLILKEHPDLPGIHYRLGRIVLSRPPTETTGEDAKKEFEAELKNDPNNAGAEYILGELARKSQHWDDAIAHFTRATKLDSNFANAFLGLGFALVAAGHYEEAIAPLESEVKLQPGNPTGHYQLTIAYGKTGRKEDAEREMALFQQASEKALKESHGEGQPAQQPQ